MLSFDIVKTKSEKVKICDNCNSHVFEYTQVKHLEVCEYCYNTYKFLKEKKEQ